MTRSASTRTGGDLLIHKVRLGLGRVPADVWIRGGRIAAIGPVGTLKADDNMAGSAGDAGFEVLNGNDGTLLPGLRDAHVHFGQWTTALHRVDLSGSASAVAAAELMVVAHRRSGDSASNVPSGNVLFGFGFRAAPWPDQPHKEILQRALPDVPTVLVSQDLHAAWFSPAALAMIGLEHPTGLLREAECFAALERLPERTVEQLDRWAIDAAHRAAAVGITEITDFEFTDTSLAWTRRSRMAGRLPLRVRAAVRPGGVDEAIERGLRTGDPVAGTQSLVTVGPCKVLMDGSLNTRTALCHDPYPGIVDPAESRGLLTQDPDELIRLMKLGADHGLSFAVHAIGDRANTLALDCFQAAGVGGRIEHAQLVSPADLPRFAALGVIAGVQPAHAVEDRDVADVQWHSRTDRAFPYASLLAAGATLEFGSDAPVSRLDPWSAIEAAVTRTSQGRPAWHGEQAISVPEAIAASTGGRVTPDVGDRADLVLIARDPMQVPPAELARTEVLATVLDGRLSYRAD